MSERGRDQLLRRRVLLKVGATNRGGSGRAAFSSAPSSFAAAAEDR